MIFLLIGVTGALVLSGVLWLLQRRQTRRNGPTLVPDLKALWDRPVLVEGKEHHPKVKVLWADKAQLKVFRKNDSR